VPLAYTLEAVVAAEPVARVFADEYRSAVVVELEQGFALVPMAAPLIVELAAGGETWRDAQLADEREPRLPEPLERALAELSREGAVAYVEAVFWGGEGAQGSVVWERGEVVLGPLAELEGIPPPPDERAINQALRHLGVRFRRWKPSKWDEFDALGLGRVRRTEAWTALAGSARSRKRRRR
jgi:hypothetical protein